MSIFYKHQTLPCVRRIRKHLDDLLGNDGVLFLPTVPGPAPVCNIATDKLDAFRGEVLCLACIASIGGLPQVCLNLFAVLYSTTVGDGMLNSTVDGRMQVQMQHELELSCTLENLQTPCFPQAFSEVSLKYAPNLGCP